MDLALQSKRQKGGQRGWTRMSQREHSCLGCDDVSESSASLWDHSPGAAICSGERKAKRGPDLTSVCSIRQKWKSVLPLTAKSWVSQDISELSDQSSQIFVSASLAAMYVYSSLKFLFVANVLMWSFGALWIRPHGNREPWGKDQSPEIVKHSQVSWLKSN